ncbi:hypothetical protein LTR08_008320 [Meristemomyces frigidus]|nr:hypothetical protein LTR08_008320 [Meristemomyces frigidus]
MAAVAIPSGTHSRYDTAFTSVFPASNYTTPTPESTPNIGVLASPKQPFGGFNIPSNAVNDAIRSNRAWSAATRFLSLSTISDGDAWQPGLGVNSDVHDAISVLCASTGSRKQLEAWYANEVGEHFRQCVLPELAEWQQPVTVSNAAKLLERTVVLLQKSWNHYFTGTMAMMKSVRKPDVRAVLQAFDAQAKQSFHTLVLTSFPRQRLQKTLAVVFFQSMSGLLSKHTDPDCFEHAECHCPINLDLPLAKLQRVGLGGNLGQRAFAHAVHKLLEGPVIDKKCFRVDHEKQQSVIPKLRRWVGTHLTPFIEKSLAALTDDPSLKLTDNDTKQFAQMAVSNLGRRRTTSLFYYVNTWPHTKGAILDIKEYITSDPAEKARVCSNFIAQIQHRLLHAGPQTTEILGVYANIIHAFRLLDARGVMLEKVAGPIRSYLRSRDDTVSIIAASFLAEVDQDGNVVNADPAKVCSDITLEVSESTVEDTRDHKMMDWNDMQWQPDPIDAGPEYKASKSEDVMAYILGLFDQDDFIKEVTTVLAQHLLQVTDPEFVKETRLIELFKSRLDATKLQAAEVMLKDVRDSVSLNKRINPRAKLVSDEPPKPREIQAAIPEGGITGQSLFQVFEHRMKHAQFVASLKLVATRRNDFYYPKRTRLPAEPIQQPGAANIQAIDHKVQILSGFFWPQMRANEFALPARFAELDMAFGHRFSLLGNQRKLRFRRALARVTVELELEDRHVSEADVPAWRASVIDVFGAEDYDAETGVTPTQLAEALQMEEELVVDALGFWTGKRVLYQRTPGLFAVLERLDMDTGFVAARTQQQSETMSAMMSQDVMLREGAPMFETFIKGMLRDGGPKEVAGFMGITNMLKMVLPTFTYGEEEVMWLLGGMEGRGEVASNGELWAFVR